MCKNINLPLIFCQWFINKFMHFNAILYVVGAREGPARNSGFSTELAVKLGLGIWPQDLIFSYPLTLKGLSYVLL